MVKRSAASGPGLQSCMDYAGKEVPSHPPPPSLATGPRRLELPSQLKPFAELARMDKPIGTWLLLWPCFWSIALAAPHGSLPDIPTLASFAIGAFVLRGAGCTINDICDRDLDGRVERTRTRPLAAGLVTTQQAAVFFFLQLAIGVAWMASLNATTLELGLCSLPLVMAYPLMKRVTDWPQLFLGFTFNWGVWMGYAAVTGRVEWMHLAPLYAAGILWTLMYDTIYANQDKEDDLQVGVRSSALALGDANRPALVGFGAASVAALVGAGWAAGCEGPYYLGVAAAAAHLSWQLSTVDLNDRADCGAKFRSNNWVGAAIFAGIVLDRLLA